VCVCVCVCVCESCVKVNMQYALYECLSLYVVAVLCYCLQANVWAFSLHQNIEVSLFVCVHFLHLRLILFSYDLAICRAM
jgi:hypothetical protein